MTIGLSAQAIRRADVIELRRLSEGQAKELLKRMKAAGLLALEGAGRGAMYRLKLQADHQRNG